MGTPSLGRGTDGGGGHAQRDGHDRNGVRVGTVVPGRAVGGRCPGLAAGAPQAAPHEPAVARFPFPAQPGHRIADPTGHGDGADHQVLTWNSGAELTYQYSSAEAVGCDADALLATEYRTGTGEPVPAEAVFAALTGTGRWSGELRQRRADGEEIELLCSLTELLDEDRRRVGWVAVNRDVTDERRTERLALYDPLTGLPNRR